MTISVKKFGQSRTAVEAAVSAAAFLLAISLLILCACPLFGGVVLDGSFGTSGPLPGPNYMIPASFGKQMGVNLFQSFSQFNLITSESATFSGPSNVQNILARVTSGGPSSIDGKVSSQIQGANLFFLNPAGVLFGRHAQLDVTGSVAISTANYVKMVGGGRFNANLGGGDTLTSTPVSSFGFLNSAPAAVSVAGSALNIAPQKSFSAVAGDISIDGGTIAGQGSRVNLVSVRSAGEAQLGATDINSALDVSQFSAMGEVDLTNFALIDTSGPSGGPVFVRAGNLLLNNVSKISSSTTGAVQGGAIDIVATESVTLTDTGRDPAARQFTSDISANASGSGPGGDVNITSPLVSLSLGAVIGSRAEATATSTARGAHITINCDQLSMTDEFTVIDVDTAGLGAGGTINVFAHSISIVGTGDFTGLIAETGRINQLIATGRGGDINVHTNSLYLANGGQLATTILGSGDAGTIHVDASSVTLDPGGEIFSQSDHFATGKAGDIFINSPLLLISGGLISANTFTSGAGGNISISSDTLTIDQGGEIRAGTEENPYGAPDGGPGGNIRIVTSSLELGSLELSTGAIHAISFTHGNAGNITVQADDVTIIGSLISTTTEGNGSFGNGGDITINAKSMEVSNLSQILATTQCNGNAGNITVQAGDLRLISGGGISSDTFDTPMGMGGHGGNITVIAGSFLIDGTSFFGFDLPTGISADTHGSGGAGTIQITAGSVHILDGGQIATDTFASGIGGDITVAAKSLLLDGPDTGTSGISASASSIGNAGNITLNVGDFKLEEFQTISTSTSGDGNGGNITINANSIEINGGVVFATSDNFFGLFHGTGNAGSVTIHAGSLSITDFGSIDTDTDTAGNGGDIMISTNNLLVDTGTIEAKADIDFSTGDLRNGDAGNINIQTGLLTVTNSGKIAADTSSSGNAGNITIAATGVILNIGGQISTDTVDQGNAGTISVTASSLLIGDVSPTGSSGFNTGSGISSSSDFAPGNGGQVKINARTLTVYSDGFISTDAGTNGRGGDIEITGNLLVNEGSIEARSVFGDGPAGNITLQERNVQVTDGGAIDTSTSGAGLGGAVTIIATESLLVTGYGIDPTFGFPFASKISAETTGGGNAGTITITAGQLRLEGSAEIVAGTTGDGAGGNVIINAQSLLVDGSGSPGFGTGISVAADGSGAGGDIMISASNITLVNDAFVTATSGSPASAGSVHMTAHMVAMNSGTVSSENDGGGPAGSVSIATTGPISLKNGSNISTSAPLSNAGSIELSSGSMIRLTGGSAITASAGANGGNIHITSPTLVYLQNSSITATAGTSGSGGMGGNITIDPLFIVLNNSLISANAAAGQGGNVNLLSNFFFNSNSLITATGTTNNGTVNITAPELDLGAELITLSSSLLSAESQLRESCTAQLRGDFSSFIMVGRGGTESNPDELQTDF